MGESTKLSGRVSNVQSAGKYTPRSGKNEGKTLYKYDIELETGLAGQMASETEEAPVRVGEEITVNSYQGNSGYPDNWYLDKPKGANGFKGGGGNKQWTPDPEKETRKERWAKQIMITRHACLNTASSLISAGCGESSFDNLTGIAEKLEAWVKRGIDLKTLVPATPAPTAQQPAPLTTAAPRPASKVPTPQERAAVPVAADDDDLPF